MGAQPRRHRHLDERFLRPLQPAADRVERAEAARDDRVPLAFSTGGLAGASANANDLDGTTTLRSVPITLPSTAGQQLFFRYVFAHGANSSSADKLVASIEDSGGTRTPVATFSGSAADVDGVWKYVYAPMDAWAGQTVRIVFQAIDGGPDSLVEAEIDDIRITRGT